MKEDENHLMQLLGSIEGNAHAGALLGGDAAYKACLEIEGLIVKFFSERSKDKKANSHRI